ncbi:MAG: hypothetical protein NTY19_10715 [Planctomycetota bacterium]|nr:hypothetical protein [Planctomycetota bacterium]
MTRFSMFRSVALAGLLLLATVLPASATADAPQAKDTANSEETHRLQYKFSAGEDFRLKVVHLATVETKVQGVTETVQTRSVSTKAWKIKSVDQDGNITFSYSVEAASMWQQSSGRQEVRYDSSKAEPPPPEYKHVAESIGKPLATVTISPAGRIVDRKDAKAQFNPGIGELTIPLPEKAVSLGQQWSTEGELMVRLPDMQIKRVKTRQLYTLEKVETGVATIAIQTQILTPVTDPRVQSQLIQRIKRGTVKFDVDAGRVKSQQLDIDETVIGFSGADSIMKYLSRLSEEAASGGQVASGGGSR